ncbi:MAG TPA: 2-succinyl-5-enolpyruvyl-6-hydroxy-3-cyclohexene-1-carboxylic-acid synthase [Solirubrobacteraceae bacterium]|nr:2-succinyl-5-enolpyruvyl-6-hydroxy-3-cyclohexene-1-carboxylic-acid synthase [Solirubrobacteraceae bacterium]
MTPTDTYLGLRAFADELARCGVTDACTSPGSRNTPLVLSLVREPGLRATSHLDERAGAFFALGLAKATGRPAVLACTSGTAAANYLPAVVEAWEARVPLVVLTADRPPELREVGAGQAIDQVKLYGRHAKWYLEVDEAPATPERLRWMRRLAARAVWSATSGRPGPVHLNFSLREPLVLDEPLPPDDSGAAGGRPLTAWTAPGADPALAARVAEEVAAHARVLVVAGRLEDPAAGAAVAAFAAAAGAPLLADPLSNARRGEALAHYDLVLREEAWAAAHRPDLVLRAGDLPTSKPLRQWLARLDGTRQIALDPQGAWQDPSASVDLVLPLDPRALDPAAVAAGDGAYLEAWRAADVAAAAAIAATLDPAAVSEPLVAARTAAALGAGDTLFVASSMPVRDLEAYAATAAAPPRVLCNRGANGIDGIVATALGVAAAGGGRTVLLIGDVALAHDAGALLAVRRLGLDLTIVLVNNDGGGIFHFLPVAGERDAFEEHVATPHGLDFVHAAALYGLRHARAGDMSTFDAVLAEALVLRGGTIVEVRTDRAENLALHRRVADAVAQSVRSGT